jgi:acid phosphatase
MAGLVRAREPANLGPHKAEIRAYVKSGEYERDIAAVAATAGTWLEQRVKQGGGKLAIVFDLDETLLSNWEEIDRRDLGMERTAFAAWFNATKCPAIEPVREVYRVARTLGVEVVFLTGRPERFRAATEKNLQAIGCGDFAKLICKPNDFQGTAEKYKTAERARLEAGGVVIIANLGDQESDLAGGHAERTFKLPNPFYISP